MDPATLCPPWWQNGFFYGLVSQRIFKFKILLSPHFWFEGSKSVITSMIFLPYNIDIKTARRWFLQQESASPPPKRTQTHLQRAEFGTTTSKPQRFQVQNILPSPNPPTSHGNKAGGSVPFGTGGGTGSRGRAIGNSLSPMSPGREVQDRSHSGARRSEAFPPVQSELSSKKKTNKNGSNQRKTRENQSREFKELFKFNETNRVLYVMLSWMDICKIIYKVLDFFFWAAGAQHTDGDMVFALYVDWMAWFSR